MAGEFPAGFIWGCATASYQIEGAAYEDGKGESIWDRFSHTPGKVRNGDTGDVACDHYHRYLEDVRLMQELGLKGYRFSISWPRVLPRGYGQVNQAGLDFYNRLVDALLEAEIAPFATLYHWDLPQALQDRGGWPNRDTAKAFGEYAAVVFDELGDRLTNWITLNEPYVVADIGHRQGIHAPGHQSVEECLAAAHHLHVASGLAVQAFRESGRSGQIGITCNLAPIHPASDREEDLAAADRFDQWLNRWWLDPIYRGYYPPDLLESLERHMPEIEPGDIELAHQPLDFFGLNYYFRQIVSHQPGEWLDARVDFGPGPKTAFGWEVYPEGYYEIMTRIAREYDLRNLYLTENGCAYDDRITEDGEVHDPERIDFLEQHIAQVARALEAGVPVRGYFLWSLMDNFEWAMGYSMRFGIVYTDYETLRRIPKDSAKWYAQVIERNGLP